MAYHQHRAGVIGQHLLQQVQRFQIEVVGRFVQHQQIGRLGQRLGQHQPAALPARQHAHRRIRLLWSEQEILHVADHVARLAADDNPFAVAAGQRVGQCHGRIQFGAALIQRHDGQIGAHLHVAFIGCQRAGQQSQQRGLAGAVRPDDSNPVAAQNTVGEVAHDNAAAERFRHVIGNHHQFAGNLGLAGFHPQPAAAAALLFQLFAQAVQVTQTLDVALAPRGHAVA